MTFKLEQANLLSNKSEHIEKKPQDSQAHEKGGGEIIDLARVRAALAERKLSVPADVVLAESVLAKVRDADAGKQTEKPAELSVDTEKIRDLERAAQKLQRALEDIAADQETLSKEPAHFKNGPPARSESGRKIQQAMKENSGFDPKKGRETMSADTVQVKEELRLKKSEADYIKSQSKQAEAPTAETPTVDQRLAA